MHTWISERIHRHREKDSLIKTQFQDNYQFDLGYHQSYSLMIFLNCLLYSCIVPIIPLIAAVFFYLKYLIDKYNLIFVYFKIYESGGKIRKHVTRYMYLNMLIYLIVQAAFFNFRFEQLNFLMPAILFLSLWAVFVQLGIRNTSYRIDQDSKTTTGKNISPGFNPELARQRFMTQLEAVKAAV